MSSIEAIASFIRSEFNSEEFIPLHSPVFLGNEKKYLLETIDTTYVSSVGKFVDRFEEDIRSYTGAKYAVATVNGTSALHMSLLLSGVTKYDLVITQALSFVATCNAISYLGADPVFLDVDIETLGLSPESLIEFLKEKTIQKNGYCIHKESERRISACVPMHTFGHPTKIDEILDICERNNITVVEDAAESIGSFYKGIHTGTFGKLGAFSFNGNKTITCGGGGVIVTNDEQLGKLGKHLTTQAKLPHKWAFKHDQIGYNYRLPNLNAALAVAQLEQIELFISNKRDLAQAYKTFFINTEFKFVDEPPNSRSNFWLNTILAKNLEHRNVMLSELNSSNIMSRPCWDLLNTLPMFRDCICGPLENSKWIEQRLINLPSSYRAIK